METAYKEHIYNLVCGNLNTEDFFEPESEIVKNEFQENSYCLNAYEKMLDAYSRVCTRLGVEKWNDPDVEIIINELMDIGRYTAVKMFDYGVLYGNSSK